MPTECYRSEWVRCGKATCRSCPHGPYWYAYWREGKRTRKRYIGKADPRPGAGAGQADAGQAGPPPPQDWREAINGRATATVEIARRILGLHDEFDRGDLYRAYRQGMAKHHPDRGGDPKEAGFIASAFTYLKARFGW